MAEMVVKLDTPVPRGVYLHSIANVPGTVAEQTYISLMNPASSGRLMTLATVALSNSNTTPSIVTEPMRGWRISAHSGGTLISPSNVGKFSSLYPDSTAEVRIGNPTITKVYPIFNSPPSLDNRSSNVHNVDIPAGATFLLRPGEGIAVNKLVGADTLAWNVTLVWAETF